MSLLEIALLTGAFLVGFGIVIVIAAGVFYARRLVDAHKRYATFLKYWGIKREQHHRG